MGHFIVDFVDNLMKSFHSCQADFKVRRSLDVGQNQGIDVQGLDVAPLRQGISLFQGRIAASNRRIVILVIQVVILSIHVAHSLEPKHQRNQRTNVFFLLFSFPIRLMFSLFWLFAEQSRAAAAAAAASTGIKREREREAAAGLVAGQAYWIGGVTCQVEKVRKK